jgi:hypothetical protein
MSCEVRSIEEIKALEHTLEESRVMLISTINEDHITVIYSNILVLEKSNLIVFLSGTAKLTGLDRDTK